MLKSCSTAAPSAARCLVLLLFLCVLSPAFARAQESPGPGTVDASARVFACGVALDRVSSAAEAAEWQAADAAYNQAVDTLDAARADIEPALGEVATAPFALAYARLDELDVALRSEDAVKVRGLVAEIKQALSGLGAGSLGAGPSALVSDWRQAVAAIAGHRDTGQWIPMRNGALQLYDALREGEEAIGRATGAEGSARLAVARVFTMRLFIAALDQDAEAGRAAEARVSGALDRLLQLLGAERATATPALVGDLPQLRAFLASPGPDGLISMPIKAEFLPPGGLGAFEAELRWSPRLLRLVDVAWSLGRGRVDRDDAAGRLHLSLAQAPTGPSADTIVATLVFRLEGSEFRAEDYLPAGSADALREHLAQARRSLRLGDLAAVGTAMTAAYQLTAPSLPQDPGDAVAIGDALAGAGQPDLVSGPLLGIIERVTEPSLRSESTVASDALLVELEAIGQAFESSLAAYGAALRGSSEDAIPVLLHLEELRDTSGAVISPARGISGQVLLEDARTLAPPAEARPTASARPSPTAVAAPPTPQAAPSSGAGGGGQGALVIGALVLALALGGAWLANRRDQPG